MAEGITVRCEMCGRFFELLDDRTDIGWIREEDGNEYIAPTCLNCQADMIS
jgi:hypothetical protein